MVSRCVIEDAIFDVIDCQTNVIIRNQLVKQNVEIAMATVISDSLTAAAEEIIVAQLIESVSESSVRQSLVLLLEELLSSATVSTIPYAVRVTSVTLCHTEKEITNPQIFFNRLIDIGWVLFQFPQVLRVSGLSDNDIHWRCSTAEDFIGWCNTQLLKKLGLSDEISLKKLLNGNLHEIDRLLTILEIALQNYVEYPFMAMESDTIHQSNEEEKLLRDDECWQYLAELRWLIVHSKAREKFFSKQSRRCSTSYVSMLSNAAWPSWLSSSCSHELQQRADDVTYCSGREEMIWQSHFDAFKNFLRNLPIIVKYGFRYTDASSENFMDSQESDSIAAFFKWFADEASAARLLQTGKVDYLSNINTILVHLLEDVDTFYLWIHSIYTAAKDGITYCAVKDEKVSAEEAMLRFISSLRSSYDVPVTVNHTGKHWILPSAPEILDHSSSISPHEVTVLNEQEQIIRLRRLSRRIIRNKALRKNLSVDFERQDLKKLQATLFEMLVSFCQRMKLNSAQIESLAYYGGKVQTQQQVIMLEAPLPDAVQDAHQVDFDAYGFDDFELPPTPPELEPFLPTPITTATRENDSFFGTHTVSLPCLHSNTAHREGVAITTYQVCGCYPSLKEPAIVVWKNRLSKRLTEEAQYLSDSTGSGTTTAVFRLRLQDLSRRLSRGNCIAEDVFFHHLIAFVDKQRQHSLTWNLVSQCLVQRKLTSAALSIQYCPTVVQWYLRDENRLTSHPWSKRIVAKLDRKDTRDTTFIKAASTSADALTAPLVAEMEMEIEQNESAVSNVVLPSVEAMSMDAKIAAVRSDLQLFMREDRLRHECLTKQIDEMLTKLLQEDNSIHDLNRGHDEKRQKQREYASLLSADIAERNRNRVLL